MASKRARQILVVLISGMALTALEPVSAFGVGSTTDCVHLHVSASPKVNAQNAPTKQSGMRQQAALRSRRPSR